MNYNENEYLNYSKKILSMISIKNNNSDKIEIKNNNFSENKNKNKNKEIILTQINSNYKGSDIIKFLSFLHNHGNIPDEL